MNKKLLSLIAALSLGVSACATADAAPKPASVSASAASSANTKICPGGIRVKRNAVCPKPTPVPTPTPTPVPTPTPTPVPTPTPTPVPVPTPTPVPVPPDAVPPPPVTPLPPAGDPVPPPPPSSTKECQDGSVILTTLECPVPVPPPIPPVEPTVAATIAGAREIEDNFDTSKGIVPLPVGYHPHDSADPVGAFRFLCGPGPLIKDDPLVYPGQPGAAHLHQFLGNTGVNAYSNYTSLRTTGGTTCGDSLAPMQRTAYWIPAMLDGAGNAVKPDYMLTYYKRLPSNHPSNGFPDAFNDPITGIITGQKLGILIGIPNGLRFLFGFDMKTMKGGPTDVNSGDYWAFSYQCSTAGGGEIGGRHRTIKAVVDEGVCPLDTGYLRVAATIPQCWDGKNLDSADHRSHMAWAAEGGAFGMRACPKTHPYSIPQVASSFFFKIDANFLAGKWRLSSDEMHPNLAPGTTMHMDYWEAWSPLAKNGPHGWQSPTGCIELHKSCNNGELDMTHTIVGMQTPPGGWPSHQLVPLSSIKDTPIRP